MLNTKTLLGLRPHLINNQQTRGATPLGLMAHKDVASRRTALFIDSADKARLDITRGRKVLFFGCLLAGILLICGPFIGVVLFENLFYGDSQLVWALRKVARELWMVFSVPGLLLIACSVLGLANRVPVAMFNLAKKSLLLEEQRFQALPRWTRQTGGEHIHLDELQGLQIIGYDARLLEYRNNPSPQFELTLLLRNGERRLLAKQPRYDSLYLDGIRLAEFLGVEITDYSAYSNRLPA